MKTLAKAGAMIAVACVLAGNAWADRYHHHPRTTIHWGVYLGDPWIYRPYPYPVYVPPVVVAPPASSPVYIERQQTVPQLEPGYWYYCNEARAYYPYVKECPGPWRQVAPQPPQ